MVKITHVISCMLDLYFFVWMEKVLPLALHVEVWTKFMFGAINYVSEQLQ